MSDLPGETPTHSDWSTQSTALLFAESLAGLLAMLAHGLRGPQIAQVLGDLDRQLRGGDMRIEITADAVFSNGELLTSDRSGVLRVMLADRAIVEIFVAADTTQRELLHFAALVSGPESSDALSFQQLWREHGAWRIRVQFTPESLAAADAADASSGASILASDESSTAHLTLRALQQALQNDRTEPAAFDQLATAAALRDVGSLVSHGHGTDADGPLCRVLRRAGDNATRELLHLLVHARTGSERRRYFDAIVLVGTGIPHLISALQHPTWYVARNAAALLGAMKVSGAMIPLTATMGHHDPRVRRAALEAVGEIATADQVEAVLPAVIDPDAEVRRYAWEVVHRLGIVPTRDVVVDALRSETEGQVLSALFRVIERHPDLDVTTALVRTCARLHSSDRDIRSLCAALQLLVERSPRSTLPFLTRLRDHPEKAVRTVVMALTLQARGAQEARSA